LALLAGLTLTRLASLTALLGALLTSLATLSTRTRLLAGLLARLRLASF
jgi:hypothetical protein